MRFNLAMDIALGNHLDSVVVDSEKIAIECIGYLKEQRIGYVHTSDAYCTNLRTATFLPLDSIKAKPLDQRLRTFEGATPIIDVLEYDRQYVPALRYLPCYD